MSTLKPTKKVSKRHSLREDTVVTLSARAMDAANKNRNIVAGVGLVFLIAIVGLVAFNFYKKNLEVKAAEQISASVRSFESGDFRAALDGVAPALGLTAVVDKFGLTPTGNLARFYAADAHYRLGEFDEALRNFRAYKKKGDYLGASAYAGEAAILESRGEYAAAGKLFLRAAEVFVSEQTSPIYLLNAGQAFEKAQDYDAARETFEQIKDDFPDAAAARETDLYIARVNAQASSK